MNIKAMPIRCVRVSEEMHQIEKKLKIQANEIENILLSLKNSEDESMLIVASKLKKTEEWLRVKIRVVNVMSIALSKIAATYSKNEDNIMSYEEWEISRRDSKFGTYKINRNADRVKSTFDIL